MSEEGKHTIIHLCAKEFQLCSGFYHWQRLLLLQTRIAVIVTRFGSTQCRVEFLIIIIVRKVCADLHVANERKFHVASHEQKLNKQAIKYLPLYGKRQQVQVAEWRVRGTHQSREWTCYLFPYSVRYMVIISHLRIFQGSRPTRQADHGVVKQCIESRVFPDFGKFS